MYLHIVLIHTQELDIRICPTLKRMTRVIEKARIKGGNSAACVKDIVRAMVTVDSMDQVAIVLDILCVLHKEGLIEVVRIKERFLEAPSAGGWRGRLRARLVRVVHSLVRTHSWTYLSPRMSHSICCCTCTHRHDDQLPARNWCEQTYL